MSSKVLYSFGSLAGIFATHFAYYPPPPENQGPLNFLEHHGYRNAVPVNDVSSFPHKCGLTEKTYGYEAEKNGKKLVTVCEGERKNYSFPINNHS